MDNKRKSTIVMSVLSVGIVMTLIGAVAGIENPVYLGTTIVVFVIAIMLQVKFYRCPHCDRYLGRSYHTQARCPRCHQVINPGLLPVKGEGKKNSRQHKKKK